MELRQLRYFVALAEKLHFARAAESLHITQPSLSQQMRVLEDDLGVQLFERSKRHVALTQEGEVLLPYARHMLSLAEDARRELADRSGLQKGHIRLGVTPTVGSRLLPDSLKRFHQLHPGIELTITEDGSIELARMLDRGELDLAVLVDEGVTNRFQLELLFEERIVIALPKGHAMANRQISFEELKDESFVLCRDGYHLRDLTLEVCEAAGFSPKVSVSGTDVDTALRFVEAGLGITLVPDLAIQAQDDVETSEFTQPLLRKVSLARSTKRYYSKAAEAMAKYLQRSLFNVL